MCFSARYVELMELSNLKSVAAPRRPRSICLPCDVCTPRSCRRGSQLLYCVFERSFRGNDTPAMAARIEYSEKYQDDSFEYRCPPSMFEMCVCVCERVVCVFACCVLCTFDPCKTHQLLSGRLCVVHSYESVYCPMQAAASCSVIRYVKHTKKATSIYCMH